VSEPWFGNVAAIDGESVPNYCILKNALMWRFSTGKKDMVYIPKMCGMIFLCLSKSIPIDSIDYVCANIQCIPFFQKKLITVLYPSESIYIYYMCLIEKSMAYVREYPHKICPYMVQYLHFGILEFPLKVRQRRTHQLHRGTGNHHIEGLAKEMRMSPRRFTHVCNIYIYIYNMVSWNGGTPKWMVYNGKSY